MLVGAPGFMRKPWSSGFCKVSRALGFLGPGCGASAAQRSWRRSQVASDLVSVAPGVRHLSPRRAARSGCANAGLRGPTLF